MAPNAGLWDTMEDRCPPRPQEGDHRMLCSALSQADVLVERSVGAPVVTGAMPQGRVQGDHFLPNMHIFHQFKSCVGNNNRAFILSLVPGVI